MVDVLVNGVADERLPVTDRGLLYGDHLFETVAFVNGRAPLWRFHMARLRRDLARLQMPPPDEEQLARECGRLLAGHGRSIVRITLTRGSGGRAYEPPARPSPRRIVARRDWPQGLERARVAGLALGISPVRLAVGGLLAGIKHGNRLEQVLAADRARRDGLDEAVMLDVEGRAVEAITGNLVIELGGRVLTPGLDRAGVAGVGLSWLRRRLMEAGERRPSEETIKLGDLGRAESIMVINSVAGIRPVCSLDGRPLAISETCRRWQSLWDELFACVD